MVALIDKGGITKMLFRAARTIYYHENQGISTPNAAPKRLNLCRLHTNFTILSSRSLRSKSHTEILIWWVISTRNVQVRPSLDSPCHRTLYRKSTTTSLSFIPILLKCFRTELASCSLLCRRSSFLLAIVGDNFPIGERESTSWL